MGEVINVLIREGKNKKEALLLVQEIVNSPNVIFAQSTIDFWFENIPKIASKFRLKSHDLFILAYCDYLSVNHLYSFDNKLDNAFNQYKKNEGNYQNNK